MGVKGYKAFRRNWMCRDFQYEVGKTYKHEGKIEPCESGFHFCRELKDCLDFYPLDSNMNVVFAEIEALGKVIDHGNKSVTDEIRIVKKIPIKEVLEQIDYSKELQSYCNSYKLNLGNFNSGLYNNGCHNYGSNNLGDYNEGNRNEGDLNIGVSNIGDMNIGKVNVGHMNIGDCNSGSNNQGDYNTGSFNKTNDGFGWFNTKPSTIWLFNKPTNLTFEDFNELESTKAFMRFINNTLCSPIYLTDFISTKDLTEEESHKYGLITPYTRGIVRQLAKNINELNWQANWDLLCDEDKKLIMELPNFDKEIFKEITGVDVDKKV